MRSNGPRRTRRGPFARRRGRDGVGARIAAGEAVEVACQLRRTSTRGWGPWTPATVSLPLPNQGVPTWSVDDPVAVGYASTNEGVALPFEQIADIYLRGVRFRTEAFWGLDNDIVVVAAEAATLELAVPPGDAEPLAARLLELTQSAAGAG